MLVCLSSGQFMSLKVSSVSVRIEQLKKYNYNINNHATKFVCSCINSPWNVKANKGVNFMSLFIKKTFLKTCFQNMPCFHKQVSYKLIYIKTIQSSTKHFWQTSLSILLTVLS